MLGFSAVVPGLHSAMSPGPEARRPPAGIFLIRFRRAIYDSHYDGAKTHLRTNDHPEDRFDPVKDSSTVPRRRTRAP